MSDFHSESERQVKQSPTSSEQLEASNATESTRIDWYRLQHGERSPPCILSTGRVAISSVHKNLAEGSIAWE